MKNALFILITFFSLNLLSQTDYYYNGVDDISLESSWGDNTDGTGNAPADFFSGNIFHVANNPTPSLTSDWIIDDEIHVDDGINFTIGSSFKINSTVNNVDITNTGTITISSSNASPLRLVSILSGGTVIHNTIFSSVQTCIYNNLIIASNASCAGNITVNGNLVINSGVALNINAIRLNAAGDINCLGTLSGGTTANLTLSGTASSSLKFTASKQQLRNLTIGSANTFSLGTSLLIGNAAGSMANSVFNNTSGTLAIHGINLSVNSITTALGNGFFAGSSTSTLSIASGTLGTLTGNLLFNSSNANLSVLSYSRTAKTLTLGNDLTIANSFIISAGTFSLNGGNLTLNGDITNSGTFNASATSSLSISGSGNLPSTLLDNITTLSSLTINRSAASLTRTSNLTITNNFTHTLGTLNLNSKNLTLNGALNFGSGFITGSSSSSITIGGSGAISGSLNMTQTDANSKSLSKLSLNRSGTTLTIGNALNIYDELTPTAGTIDLGSAIVTLKSSSSQKARVGIVGASGGFSGTLNVETYVPGGSAGWNTLGPAGISGLKVSNWDGGLGSSTTFAMNCSGCTLDENSTGEHFVSIQSDPNGDGNFTELTSTSNLTPGTGYWVFIGNSLTTAIDITQTTTGPVVTGNVSSSTGFMSNPYASPILLSALKASNSGLTQIDVYDPNGSSYTSFNGGVPSDVIPAGQGFYASGVSSVIFHESDKIASNTSLLRINSAKSNIGTVFKLKIDGWYGDYDNTYIRFHDNATSTFDNDLDAYKRYLTPGYAGYGATYSNYTAISTINENKDYSINSLPYPQSSDLVIPVLAKASSTGQYTISPIGIEQLPPNTCVSLKDKLLNITHDLKTGGYVCEINDTTSTPRFELTICGNQLVTGINKNTIQDDKVLIGQDGTNGVFVKTNSLKSTKYVVSAYNIMGQKIADDRDIIGTENLIYLDLKDLHHQVIIIKVTSEKETITKKVYLN